MRVYCIACVPMLQVQATARDREALPPSAYGALPPVAAASHASAGGAGGASKPAVPVLGAGAGVGGIASRAAAPTPSGGSPGQRAAPASAAAAAIAAARPIVSNVGASAMPAAARPSPRGVQRSVSDPVPSSRPSVPVYGGYNKPTATPSAAHPSGLPRGGSAAALQSKPPAPVSRYGAGAGGGYRASPLPTVMEGGGGSHASNRPPALPLGGAPRVQPPTKYGAPSSAYGAKQAYGGAYGVPSSRGSAAPSSRASQASSRPHWWG